ncbi:MAG: putative metal-binding motif-containing protein [Deltaproteobacteria bacterium]|nr:putative metal-binding motif-containing protein [Deltaproteobacteria bacterium]
MKRFAPIFAALLALTLLPATATSQTCVPDPNNLLVLTCNTSYPISGDTVGQVNDVYEGSTVNWCLFFDAAGPDVEYLLQLNDNTSATVTMTEVSHDDASLLVFRENTAGDDCDLENPVGCSDGFGEESVNIPAGLAATYYVIADGYGSNEGTYELTVDCYTCLDADGDGFSAYDETECPAGDDCDDTDPTINPGADEICEDNLDNDCADGDAVCQYCYPDTRTIACDESVDGDTSGVDALELIDSWDDCASGSSFGSYASPELTYAFTVTDATPVTITLTSTFDSVLALVEDTGACDPATGCLAVHDTVVYPEIIETFLQPGNYYIVVDGYGSSNEGTFTLDVSCGEICTDGDGDGFNVYDADYCPSGDDCDDDDPAINPDAEDVCGDEIDQDCSGTANSLCDTDCTDLTSDPSHCGNCSTDCNVNASGVENALCNMSLCDYDTCAVGFLDCDANRSNGCELAESLTNCGACDYDCADYLVNVADSICALGACDYLNCQPGFLDCNDARNDGCEMPEDTNNCGACGSSCRDAGFENVSGMACETGQCTWDSCRGNFGDCDQNATNGCETTLDTSDNCGACGNICARLEACIEGEDSWLCSSTCADADGDGRADATCGGNDCDDTNGNIYPGAEELCNGIDDDCDSNIDEGFDADGDGFKTCGDAADCNDSDPAIHPGATEICGNDVDENCDGAIEETCGECVDADKDGAADITCGGTDCNDSDPNVGPDSLEICDNVDNNCDGQVDENDVCFQGGMGCDCSTMDPTPLTGGFMLLMLGWAALRRRDD